MDKLADLLRQGADKLINLPTTAQRFVTNPQAFVELLTGKNALPRETGFAAGATGLPAQEGTVLDPSYQAYMQGYQQGEPVSYAAMATPAALPVAKALAPKAGQMAEVPNLMGSVNLPRKAILEQQFNKTQKLNPSFLGDDLYEKGVKQVEFDDGNAYARFLQDNKGNLRLLTLETENSPNVRGRQILNWLKETYKKPIKVNEVDPPAAGYWDKMQKEGLIKDWSHLIYEGKSLD